MSRQSRFVRLVAPGAQAAMQQYGILASMTLAQAIVESGWGAHAPGNNLFGIKAYSWSGKTQILTTQEYLHGKEVTIKDVFRAYNCLSDSIKDHASFLIKNSRYKNLIGLSDYVTACNRIQADGYATEQNYASQLITIIKQYHLDKYDILPTHVIIDAPKQNAICKGDLLIGGWAVAVKGIARVDIYADNKVGLASLGSFDDRPDVEKAINKFKWYKNATKCGYTAVIPEGKLSKGKHTIKVFAIGKDGSKAETQARITIK